MRIVQVPTGKLIGVKSAVLFDKVLILRGVTVLFEPHRVNGFIRLLHHRFSGFSGCSSKACESSEPQPKENP